MRKLIFQTFAISCAVLSACANEQPYVTQWEHSASGLYEAQLSADGRFAVVSSFSDGTSYWDLAQNKRLYDWRHSDDLSKSIGLLAIAPSGSHVITADTRTYVVWNTQSGKAEGYWGVDGEITAVAISNDGTFVLLGLKDGRAIHINQKTFRRLEVIAHRNQRVSAVDLSADGTIAVTGGSDDRAMVWNAISGDEMFSCDHHARLNLVALDPQGTHLLTADESGNAFVWKVERGEKLTHLELQKHERKISAARFSKDGTQLLLGFPGRKIGLWSVRSGEIKKSWMAPERRKGWVPQGSTIYDVAFNAQETEVIAESSNGLARSWAISGGG